MFSRIQVCYWFEKTYAKFSFTKENLFGKGYDRQGVFDIRLKENFTLFISGPSRCGKTVFVSKLLENIHTFGKLPPKTVIYVHKV